MRIRKQKHAATGQHCARGGYSFSVAFTVNGLRSVRQAISPPEAALFLVCGKRSIRSASPQDDKYRVPTLKTRISPSLSGTVSGTV